MLQEQVQEAVLYLEIFNGLVDLTSDRVKAVAGGVDRDDCLVYGHGLKPALKIVKGRAGESSLCCPSFLD